MTRFLLAGVPLAWLLLPTPAAFADDAPKEPASTPRRAGWTTSRLHGSPEPPPPYVTERLWPKLAFDQPVEMVVAPGEQPPYVVERKGRIVRMPTEQDGDALQIVLGTGQIKGLTALYGLAFHPEFERNRLCYLCYVLEPELPDGTRVSQFRMMDDTETWAAHLDVTSEKVLLTFKSGGHNGGSLKFGPDGFLYVTTGDGTSPSPPDALDTGQDVSDLLSSVLRIDVDHAEGDRPYAIPADNPFVDLDGARPEIWAYGFRNPWRMSFDRATGDLWLGDVGWQLWEMVYRVERGGNYGWSVKEGPQTVRPEATHGPTPILPPTKSLPRADAASVTGGFVYRGERIPDLVGTYVYGDYVTGKVWALKHENGNVTSHRELTDTPYAIICFFEDHAGELALLDYNAGTIHRLVPNDAVGRPSDFPTRLSKTGLFADTAGHVPAAGVHHFDVNVARWMDGLEAERFVAVPDTGTLMLREPTARVPNNQGNFPADTVLAKTLFAPQSDGSLRRVETQILHFAGDDWRGNGGEWAGYTYLWNDEQTDAELAPAQGTDLDVRVLEKQIRWHVSSRTECYACHNPWAGYRLGFTIPQLNTAVDRVVLGTSHDQLSHLELLGLVELPEPRRPVDRMRWPRFVDPHSGGDSLEERARAYLHVNCAHCHRVGGGGTATMLLAHDVPLAETEMVARRPTQGAFGIAKAEIVAPGDPFGSVLFYRMSKLGRGRMPHVGSGEIDKRGVALVRDWISSLERDESHGPGAFEENAGVLSDVLAIDQAATEEERMQLVERMLGSTRGALALANGMRGVREMPFAAHAVKVGRAHERPEIRDLFEPFVPASERLERLGSSVDPEAVLALEGDVRTGRRLFFEARGVDCRKCHRIGDAGGQIGPELSEIGKRLDRSKLLTSILEPSLEIDPKWRTWILETKRGRVHSGLLVDRTDAAVVLRQPSDGKDVSIAAADVEQLVPSLQSPMPDLLFRDMTARELADLLAFLESLR